MHVSITPVRMEPLAKIAATVIHAHVRSSTQAPLARFVRTRALEFVLNIFTII